MARTKGVAFWAAVSLWSVLAVPGCLEVQTTTVVHRDGSLTRTVLFAGDSANIPAARRILGVDAAWTLEAGMREKKHTLKAERRFPDIDAMARAISGDSGRTVRVLPQLESTFRWFTTAYRYSETWRRLHTVDEVPLSDYVSSGEIDMFYRHELEKESFASRGDSLAMADAEDRYREWDARNWFEAYYKIFLQGVKDLGDPGLPLDTVAARKEMLFRATAEKFGIFGGEGSAAITSMGVEFARVLKNPAAARAAEARADQVAALAAQQKFVQEFTPYGYTVEVEMPGLITDTNAGAVEGSRVSWKGFEGALCIADYEMWVESSAVNWWAIVVSALVLVLALVLTIAGMLRGRRAAPAA